MTASAACLYSSSPSTAWNAIQTGAADHGRTHAVAFRHREAELRRHAPYCTAPTPRWLPPRSRPLPQPMPETTSGRLRPLVPSQWSRPAPASIRQVRHCRRPGIERMRHGKSEPGQIVGSRVKRLRSTSSSWWRRGVATNSGPLSCCTSSRTAWSFQCGNLHLLGNLLRLVSNRLASRQRQQRRGIRSHPRPAPTRRRQSPPHAAMASAAGPLPQDIRCRLRQATIPFGHARDGSRSGPTSVRNAKLASIEARGEPMPITLHSLANKPARDCQRLAFARWVRDGSHGLIRSTCLIRRSLLTKS